jgi:hypothetical protein
VRDTPVRGPGACLLALAVLGPVVATGAEHPLRVSDDGRHLVQADGQPFFYLGDTAWQLLHRLSREEAELYLEDRAAKGFTVVQTVVLAELDGLETPNAQAGRPLFDNDPRRPNPAYFEHVDFVIGKAEELGLTIGLLPTWGDKWHNRQNTPGPRVFDAENAKAYARFVGERYRDRAVIFILGGDRNPETEEDYALVRAMARGLKATAPRNLVTYHPRGPGRSSDFFQGEDWLDFNMTQSSHTGRGLDKGANVAHDRALEPPKPTLDGEPLYEAIIVDFYMEGANPALRFDATDARMVAYRSLLAGAAGHTYGNNNIWQMWAPGREPVLGADTPWYEALDHPGAFQMGHLRRLFESRPWTRLVPDQGFVLSENPAGAAFIRAAVASDGSFAFVYSPEGAPFVVDQGHLGKRELTYWWFDPRYGRAYPLHTGTGTAMQAFTPPSSGPGRDWLLVIDDPARGFPPPGHADAE